MNKAPNNLLTQCTVPFLIPSCLQNSFPAEPDFLKKIKKAVALLKRQISKKT